MNIFASLEAGGYEEVAVLNNQKVGLQAFLAIHDTTRGPALGGVRVHSYFSEEAALAEALRLARAMTLKTALADLPVGGAKVVVLADRIKDRRAAFELLAHHIERYGGRFYTASDLGTTEQDIQVLRSVTRWVCHEGTDGVDSLHDATAIGAMHALRAAVKHVFGAQHLVGLHVAIQGAGGVGAALAQMLAESDAALTIADVNAERARQVASRTGATVVPPENIFAASCDVFVPCAISGVLNASTIPRLNTKLIVPVANAVLREEATASQQLTARGIVYVPDFAVNSGAVIQGALFLLRGDRSSPGAIARIGATVEQILSLARTRGATTLAVAEELALSRLKKDKDCADLYWPRG